MLDQELDCLAGSAADTRPVHPLRPDGLAAFLDTLLPARAAYLRDIEFTAKAGELALLPGPHGVAAAVLGVGTNSTPFTFGGLPMRLPESAAWRLEAGDYDPEAATLGYCLGAYRYERFRSDFGRGPAPLFVPPGHEAALSQAAATWMVRDLINTPANILGPVELAEFAASLADRYGAQARIAADAELEQDYPAIAAVGRGSARPPRVVTLRWRGSAAPADAPLVSLCGKECFDTGGYDLKRRPACCG